MPIPKVIRVPDDHDDNERVVDVSKTLERITDTSRTYDRVEEVIARKNSFIEQAINLGGFTKQQAEWLWENVTPKEPLRY